jgi:hypothetical protein
MTSDRGKLPVWVVRILDVLVFISATLCGRLFSVVFDDAINIYRA